MFLASTADEPTVEVVDVPEKRSLSPLPPGEQFPAGVQLVESAR